MAKFFTGLLLGHFESDVHKCKACQGEIDKDDKTCEVDEIDQDGHPVPSAGIVEPAMEEETALVTGECLGMKVVLVVVVVVMMLSTTLQVVVPHVMTL